MIGFQQRVHLKVELCASLENFLTTHAHDKVPQSETALLIMHFLQHSPYRSVVRVITYDLAELCVVVAYICARAR